MKYFTTLLIATILALASMAQPGKKVNTDSVQIRNTIISFYNWYLKNQAKLNSFELYQGLKVRDEPPYKINWNEAERYFGYIRSSVPQLGEAFIKNQRVFLKQCDSAFKVDLEDEIPYGFDYDWYTNSQEDPSYLVDEIKKSKRWLIKVEGIAATVEILTEYNAGTEKSETGLICFKMKKETGKWKIAEIGCAFSLVQ